MLRFKSRRSPSQVTGIESVWHGRGLLNVILSEYCKTIHATRLHLRRILIKLLVPTAAFLMACQREGDLNYYITNLSDKSIIVTFALTRDPGDTSSRIVWAGAKEQFIHTYQHYPPPKKLKECPCSPSVLEIRPGDTSFIILKDINNPDNWERRLVKGGIDGADYTDCYFVVHQADLR